MLIHTKLASWQALQPLLMPLWICAVVGTGAANAVPGAVFVATAGTSPEGTVPRWQLSQVVLDGRRSILGSHLDFGEAERGWTFVSPGHGDVDFEALFRVLNRIGYEGPLSVEWEDSGMDREWGAADAADFLRRTDFSPSAVVFDAAFQGSE